MNVGTESLNHAYSQSLEAAGTPSVALETAGGQVSETTRPALLDGKGVTVTEATDLQRMMDELKLAQDEARRKLTLQQFEIALRQLTAQNEHITQAQNAAIGNVADAATALEAAQKAADSANLDVAEKEQHVAEATKTVEEMMTALGKQSGVVAELEKELSALKMALNDKTAVLDMMIQSLTELVEAQKKSSAEREKEIRAKEERAAEEYAEVKEESIATQEDEELQRQIDALTTQIETVKVEIAGLAKQVDTCCASLSVAQETLATQQAAVTAAQAALQKAQDDLTASQSFAIQAKNTVETAASTLTKVLHELDEVGLKAIAGALDRVAVQVLEARGETDEDTSDAKTNAIQQLAEDLSRAIEERNDEDLEKLIAKLPDALDWFAQHAVTHASTSDFPDFTIRA